MNPLKPGKNVHFYVRRRLNQTLFLSLSLSLSLEKKKESNLDTAQFYTLSYNSNPNEFRPRCIPPTPEITAKQSDSTRRFNPPRAPLTDLFNRVEKRNNPRYNVTREKETVRRERWERKHDDTSRKLKRRIMGGISRRRAFEIITRCIKFLRGASQTMTAHKISNPSLSLFFSPFAASLLCKSVFASPHTVANLTLWLPDRSQDNHFCIGHRSHATNSANALV